MDESSQLRLELRESGDAIIRILSLDGALVYSKSLPMLATGTHKISLSPARLSEGMYLLSCIVGGEESALRFIVSK